MSRGRGALLILAVASATVVVALPASRVHAEQICVRCHAEQRVPLLRRPVEAVEASVHWDAEVSCADCHGGDPEMDTVLAHQAEGFRTRLEAGAAPALCGDCHARAERMHEIDPELPTDQGHLYDNSAHGRAFAAGNTRAASCGTCHGHHEIHAPDDPRSRVHPAHVAETCGACHSEPGLSELPIDQEEQWRRSVHGRAHARWLEERDESVEPSDDEERHPPTCNDCHSVHEFESREDGIRACPGCHEEEWESFEASPHKDAFARLGFLPCVDCHGSHEIQEADASLIGAQRGAACRRCHAEGQEMFDLVRRMGERQAIAEGAANRAREAVDRARESLEMPLETAVLRDQELREAERRLYAALHALDEERIEAASTDLVEIATRIAPEAVEGVEDDDAIPVFRDVVRWVAALAIVVAFAFLLWNLYKRRRGAS